MSRMKNTKPFKKSMRLKVLKIFEFKIKTIICRKTEISAATILKNWQLQRSDKKQGERKKKRKKNTPPHFIYFLHDI